MTESIIPVLPEYLGVRLSPEDKMMRRCVAMIAGRQWVVGHSHYTVAKQFGVSPRTAYNVYRQALRHIRLTTDANATREQLLLKAKEIVDEDEADRLPAMTLIAKMTGALEPPKGEPQTHEERVEYLRECLRQPDDELLEALLAEREAVLSALAIPAEGTESMQEQEP